MSINETNETNEITNQTDKKYEPKKHESWQSLLFVLMVILIILLFIYCKKPSTKHDKDTINILNNIKINKNQTTSILKKQSNKNNKHNKKVSFSHNANLFNIEHDKIMGGIEKIIDVNFKESISLKKIKSPKK